MPTPRLDPRHTALLVVDMQDRLMPVMHETEQLVRRAGRLIDGFNALGLPVLVTEQYRKGLGETVPELAKRLHAARCNQDKLKFTACVEPVRQELIDCGARSVVVAGIEAHVCVLLTALDLLDGGYITAVAVDATSSRRAEDKEMAVSRMTQAGVLPATVESVLFELTQEAGGERFRALREIVT